jgi:hypothetical protein
LITGGNWLGNCCCCKTPTAGLGGGGAGRVLYFIFELGLINFYDFFLKEFLEAEEKRRERKLF